MDVDNLEFLKECAFESSKDDFESIATLEVEIRNWAAEEGKDFSSGKLLAAISVLVQEKRLKVYRFMRAQGQYVETTFDASAISELWFKSCKS